MDDGYEFFADGKLVTLTSAVNYRGEFENAGAGNCRTLGGAARTL